MARFWKELLDVERHTDHMSTLAVGGNPVARPADNIVERWVYFVEVCSFTFQFVSLKQIEECLFTSSQKIHPSSIEPNVTLEHYWQSWEQRIPLWLFEEPRRQKIVNALQRALIEFTD